MPQSGALVTGHMHAPAKIADLEFAIDAQEKILRLDISMDDILSVEVGKCIGHLVDVDSAAPLQEGAILCELLVELAFAGKFKHEKDVLFVMEIAVEAEDVWVSEVLLDFDFTTDLLFHLGLDDLGLVETSTHL